MRLRPAVLLTSALLASGCPFGANRGTEAPALQLRVVSIPAADPAAYRREEYLQLVASRANVTSDPQSPFWKALRWYFVDRRSSVVMTADVKVNGRQVGLFPLFTLKAATAQYSASAVSNLPLAAPLRLQDADDVSIHLSLVEVTQDQEEQLLKLLRGVSSTAASLPVSTIVPGGEAAFDLMTSVAQTVQILGKPRDVTLEVEEHVNPLWKDAYLLVVPAQDIERVRADLDRLLSPNWVPRTDDPTFVALRVERKAQLFTPDLALGPTSPVRDKVARFVNDMKSGTDEEKVAICRRLRTFLQSELGLNKRDETSVVLGAMREGGYDPDRSRAHLHGCFTTEDIDEARRAGFRWGTCTDSAACRAALAFADAWVARRSFQGIATAPLAWHDHLFEKGRRMDDDPVRFAEEFTLYPNYALPVVESEGTATVVGFVGRDGGEVRRARLVLSLSPVSGGDGMAVARVDLCDAGAPPVECGGLDPTSR